MDIRRIASLEKVVTVFPPSTLPYRWCFVESLLAALRSGRTVQVAYLRIHNFEALFNLSRRQTRGPQEGPGYVLGDAAIHAFGEILHNTLGVHAGEPLISVYNDGPAFFVLDEAAGGQKLATRIASIWASDAWRRDIVARIRDRVRGHYHALTADADAHFTTRVHQELDTLHPAMIHMHGGVSPVAHATHPGDAIEALALARALTQKAYWGSVLSLLSFSAEFGIHTLREVMAFPRHRRQEQAALAFASIFNTSRRAAKSGLFVWSQQSAPSVAHWVQEAIRVMAIGASAHADSPDMLIAALQDAGLELVFTLPHLEFSEEALPPSSYRAMLHVFIDAVARNDCACARMCAERMLAKRLVYRSNMRSSIPVFVGDNLILPLVVNSLIVTQPTGTRYLVFYRGGDEIARVIWDGEARTLTLQKFDLNDAASMVVAFGYAEARRYAEEILRVVAQTRDFENIGHRVLSLPLPPFNAIIPVTLDGEDSNQSVHIDMPTYKDLETDGRILKHGSTLAAIVRSQPMLCGGSITLTAGIIPVNERHRDFSFLEQRADALFLRNKRAMKSQLLSRHERVDPSIALQALTEPLQLSTDELRRLPVFPRSATDLLIVEFIMRHAGY